MTYGTRELHDNEMVRQGDVVVTITDEPNAERSARDASRFEGLTVGTSKHIRSRGVFLARQVTVIEVVFLRITIAGMDA